MNKKFYNEDSEHQEIIKLLKDLPKVTASDNFEFNLMTHINNKNFKIKSEQKQSNFFWVLVPATGLVISAVVIFFVFFNQSNEFNLLLQEPAKIMGSVNNNDYPKNLNDVILDQKPLGNSYAGAVSKKKSATSEPKQSKTLRIVVKPNDVIDEEYVNLPFDKSKSVNVDAAIDNFSKNSTQPQSTLVGGVRKQSGFDGFYIREQLNRKFLKEWRARLDSINKNLNQRVNSPR